MVRPEKALREATASLDSSMEMSDEKDSQPNDSNPFIHGIVDELDFTNASKSPWC